MANKVRTIFIGSEAVNFPDNETGEIVNVTKYNFAPVDEHGGIADPVSYTTRVALPGLVIGQKYLVMTETSEKTGKEKMLGVVPLVA